MKLSQSGDLKVMLLAAFARLKIIATADYVISDFHPSKVYLWLKPLLLKWRPRLDANEGGHTWSLHLKQCVIQHRHLLIWPAIALCLLVLTMGVLLPYESKLQDRLLLRPYQWAYLQNLNKDTQIDLALAEPISRFGETELQSLRTVLVNRGIKPITLILTAGSSPELELQMNELMFSDVLELLDQMRITWHLYPSQLSIRKTESAGIVNMKGHFVQHQPMNANGMNRVSGE